MRLRGRRQRGCRGAFGAPGCPRLAGALSHAGGPTSRWPCVDGHGDRPRLLHGIFPEASRARQPPDSAERLPPLQKSAARRTFPPAVRMSLQSRGYRRRAPAAPGNENFLRQSGPRHKESSHVPPGLLPGCAPRFVLCFVLSADGRVVSVSMRPSPGPGILAPSGSGSPDS